MPSMDDIVLDGFFVHEQDTSLKNLAILSLRVALRSFCSTYKSVKDSIALLHGTVKKEQSYIDNEYSLDYYELCCEVIVHFQHFAELVVKDFLYEENPLLALNAAHKPLIFHKLLKGEDVDSSQREKLKSIEFSDALKTLCELIKEKRLSDKQIQFILDLRPVLEKLNELRNRIWHKGAFVLRYSSLDWFVGQYLLPFANQVVNHPNYSKLNSLWKYHTLSCGIDPLVEIMTEFKADAYDLGKIAMLKELGRAAYDNPMGMGWGFDETTKRHLEKRAAGEIEMPNIADVRMCPVCGCKTLIVYDDIDCDEYDPEKHSYGRAWKYTWQVSCISCSFEIDHQLNNPKNYGLPIEDFWFSEDLE